MIYCANNNVLYKQARDVCKDLGLSEAAVSKHLNGERRAAGCYVLARINKPNPKTIKALRAWLLYSTFKIVLDVHDEPIFYEGSD